MKSFIAVAVQFIKFGLVGFIGFVLDTGVLYVCLYLFGLGFYGARLISYAVAATITWALHRGYTFRDTHEESPRRQWARFLAVNAVGGLVNYGTYAGLIASGQPFTTHPVLAVIAGVIPALLINFSLSRTVVFRMARPGY